MTPNEEWGLIGKVAIVTGGGAAEDGIGNGRAAAILLARAGAHVLVVDRDLTLAERSVAMIAAEDLMTPLILRWHRTFVRRWVGRRASGRTAR